ncbi:MAG: gamma-glutamyltransferase, partial [Candidatus Cybelea sp.]
MLTGAANDAVRGNRAEGWLEQTRSPVVARNGMVTTSQPLAAQAGLRILMQGGNAIDAAVATAAALNVTEPMNVGFGGDLFALVYIAKEHRIHALDASGTAPTGATLARMHALGYAYDPTDWGPGSGMPSGGILDVTVPGAAWGWDEILRRYGTMKLPRVLAPAVDYAANGFPVSERIAREWVLPNALPLRACCTRLDPDSVATWYVGGAPPAQGQIFRNPQLARTLVLLGERGPDIFYKGEIARAIVAKSHDLRGTMTLADLAAYRGIWTDPVRTTYHGYDVMELPPPSQGFAANEALNISKNASQNSRRAKRSHRLAQQVLSIGTFSLRRRNSHTPTCTRTTPTRNSRRRRSRVCSRTHTLRRCVRRSIRRAHRALS